MTNEDKLKKIIRNIIKEEIAQVQNKETERESAMTSLRVLFEEWLEYIEEDFARIPKYQSEANEEMSRVFKTQVNTQEIDDDSDTITFAALLQPQVVLKACLENGDREYMEDTYGDLNSIEPKDLVYLADDTLSELFYFNDKVRVNFRLKGNMIEACAEFPLIMNYCDLDYRIRNLFNN